MSRQNKGSKKGANKPNFIPTGKNAPPKEKTKQKKSQDKNTLLNLNSRKHLLKRIRQGDVDAQRLHDSLYT